MEKISYPPLIKHLKAEEEYYTHLLAEFEIKHGFVPGDFITLVMVEYIEPLIKQLANEQESVIAKISKAMFSEMLKYAVGNTKQKVQEDYLSAWRLLPAISDLFRKEPVKVLSAFSSAIQSIDKHQAGRTREWLSLMEQIVNSCSKLSDLLYVGRITAWMCGLAHLRSNALMNYESLSDDLKDLLNELFREASPLEECLRTPGKAKFAETVYVGGFIGFSDGLFNHPPKVMKHDDCFIASDGHNSCALYVDACGLLVLPNVPIDGENIMQNADLSDPKSKQLKKAYKDLTSVSSMGEVTVYTRESSFHLFVKS